MKGVVLIMKYRFILMRDCYKASHTFWFNAINYGITGAYSECTCDMIKED